MRSTLVNIIAMLGFAPAAYAAPTFILNDVGGVGIGTQARAGFEAAAAIWSSEITNDVTIRLNVGFQKLGSGILASTGTSSSQISYSAVRDALGQGATSANDRSAYASLGPTLSFESNADPLLPVSAAVHVFENNQADRDTQWLWASTANQKALGRRSNNDASADGSIIFGSAFRYTFDTSKGVAKGTYDFVGVAEHEIAHALGFLSGVDTADVYAKYGLGGLQISAWGSPLDLFRYQNGVRDWTVGGSPCLSVDGGQTCGARFATGQLTGDHSQASHWKAGLHLGILNPSLASGVAPQISANDLEALDVIGWDLATENGAANGKVTWASTPNGAPNGSWSEDNEIVGVAEPAITGLLALAAIALTPFVRRGSRARMRPVHVC